MNYNVVLFDLDGVVIDSNQGITKTLYQGHLESLVYRS